MQMLIYLFSLIYNQTPLQDAKIGGVLYMPAGGVKTNQERGSSKSKQELEQDAYRMSGLLTMPNASAVWNQMERASIFRQS